MNIRNTFSLLLGLVFIALFVTAQSSAVVLQKGPEAFGEGQFSFQGEQIDFSFDAKANENGKAHGQAQFTFTNSSSQTEVTVRINCLNADSASISASISGVVQHSDDPDYPKHSTVLFAVIDKSNFPVPSSGIDQITPLFVISPDSKSEDFNCTNLFPLTILDINGNITIEQ